MNEPEFETTNTQNSFKIPMEDYRIEEVKEEMVNSPKHYQIFPEYEVRDLCKVMADRMEGKYSAFFISDYVQFLQYVLRFDMKNGKEDLEKSQYYLNKMIETIK